MSLLKIGGTLESEEINFKIKKSSSNPDATDEALEHELTSNVRQKVYKIWKELKNSPMYRKQDPQSLRSRVLMLDSGDH